MKTWRLFDWLVLKDRCETFLAVFRGATAPLQEGYGRVEGDDPVARVDDARRQLAIASVGEFVQNCACDAACERYVPSSWGTRGVHPTCKPDLEKKAAEALLQADVQLVDGAPQALVVRAFWEYTFQETPTADLAKAIVSEMLAKFGITNFELRPIEGSDWRRVEAEFTTTVRGIPWATKEAS